MVLTDSSGCSLNPTDTAAQTSQSKGSTVFYLVQGSHPGKINLEVKLL